MTFLTHILGVVLTGLVVVACSSTTMSGSWSSPDHKQQIENVYIIGISQNEIHRRIFEDTFGRQLASHGVKTVSSYNDLPANEESNREDIIKAMTDNGCDSVLLTKLVSQRTETVTNPGYVSGYSSGPYYGGRRGGYGRPAYYNSWGSYYNRSYDVVYQPPTTTTFVVLTVESVLYDLKTEEMIWSAQLETFDEGNIEKMMQDFVNEVTKDLKKNGLI